MINDPQAARDVNARVNQLQTQVTTNSQQVGKGSIILRRILFGIILTSFVVGALIAGFDFYLQKLPPQKQAQYANFAWTHPASQIILVIVIPLLSLLIGFLQLRFSGSSGTSASQPYVFFLPYPQSRTVQEPPFPTQKATFHNMIVKATPIDSEKFERRDEAVKALYDKLIDLNIRASVMTGIGGVGKSVLALQIYRYVEEQRINNTNNTPFSAESIWLRVDENSTMLDISGSLFTALGKTLPADFSNYTPRQQATAIFEALNNDEHIRLVILDQFDFLLDKQTGQVPANRPGISEWLNEINCQPGNCRLLLTSRIWLEGIQICSPGYIQEEPAQGLTIEEGIKLLQSQHIAATEEELEAVVALCDGHALALIGLAGLLRRRKLSIKTLLHDPWYAQFWGGDTLRHCLRYIRQEINDMQYKLLLAFSIFRQPVPLDAFQDFKDLVTNLSPSQIRPALDTLLIQNLLRASDEGRYQVHPVVGMYIQSDFVESGESSYQQTLRLQSAHIKAAQYYLQQFSKTGLPHNQRRQLSDVQLLIEAIWQYTQADLFQKAYDLATREDIFTQLKSWGENTALLKLYQLLLSSDQWLQEKQETAAHMYQELGIVYSDLHQQEKAEKCAEKANSLRQETAIQP